MIYKNDAFKMIKYKKSQTSTKDKDQVTLTRLTDS